MDRGLHNGFALNVAYIIPFTLIKSTKCPQLAIWRMLEFSSDIESANSLFNVLSEEVNHQDNLVSLDNSIHSMFDNGVCY